MCACVFELGLTSGRPVPHASRGAVLEVLQQLREAEHGLEHHSQRAQRLHEHGGVEQQQGDQRAQHREAETEEQVVLEGTPLPEVAQVQFWGEKGEKTGGLQIHKSNYTELKMCPIPSGSVHGQVKMYENGQSYDYLPE